ncbi:26356_t:CDS:1, partial [Dentiscutata erythropus]
MSELMVKRIILRFCLLFFLVMVVKTSPIKKSKRIDLKSCLYPIKGQMVFPDDPQYIQDIKDENTRVTFHPI